MQDLNLSDEDLAALSQDDFNRLLADLVDVTAGDRKQSQIRYYKPVSDRAQKYHDSTAKTLAAGGGNRSGKTETMLAHMVMCTTGVFPKELKYLAKEHFRGPINVRLTVESLTTTLEPVIFPKLQWWKWSGAPPHGGTQGHWGWIPKDCLIDGDWQKSYSAKTRTLRVICRDPDDYNHILGESVWQFMSFDQDASDFASGEFYICAHDEPPPYAIWHENESRVMSVGGRMLLAMTWPDDPSIPVDWLFNDVYEPAKRGAKNIEWMEFWTEQNANIDQEGVAHQKEKWSEEIKNVRLYGRPIRFSNRIHPEFTDLTKTWCFKCNESVTLVEREYEVMPHLGAVVPSPKVCPKCQSENTVDYKHVRTFEVVRGWPTVFVIDPHPRKPHMYLWVQISPGDDWYVIADGKTEGDCSEVKAEVEEMERMLGLQVVARLVDPNMGASPAAASRKREVTWQQEFADADLPLDLADDSSVGRARINTMLQPDPDTLAPRLIIHSRCADTIYQFNRYSWDEYKKSIDRDQKQQPKDTYSDYPTCLKYLANMDPVFNFLKESAPIVGRGKRTGSY